MLNESQVEISQDVLADQIRSAARPLIGADDDYDPLLERIGDARYVLLGEASHGTHEFYRERAKITQRLILEKGFVAVAAEADWPDAHRVNRFVRGRGDDAEPVDALGDFHRFPAWMWRNADVVDFVAWLRDHNAGLDPNNPKVGFYGLDLYSLRASMEAVIAYLDTVDPNAAARARDRYACFDLHADPQSYGHAAALGLDPPCREEVIAQLLELRRSAANYESRDGLAAEDEFFSAEQNARVAQAAEEYYRAMCSAETNTWNLRDWHMAKTLECLAGFLDQRSPGAKIVVWAHNSHVGDARATRMGERGEWNIGQLSRGRYGGEAVLVGFTTHHGTVTAASNWSEPAERKRVRPALAESYEGLFHVVGFDRFLLILEDDERTQGLRRPRLERAIGVIYRPESERASHYFRANLHAQFDAVIHFDRTRAVKPLERMGTWDDSETPEMFPTGF